MSQSTINGIFVPNIVPYDSKGRIDEDELRHIIRWVGDKGVTGFYPNGNMVRTPSMRSTNIVTSSFP